MYKSYVTDRLTLKVLGKEAAPMVLSFYSENKEHFEKWEPSRSKNFYTLAYHKASLCAEHNQMSEGRQIRYWLFLKDNPNEIIGSVCFQNFLGEPYKSCTIGYKISSKFLRRGYAYEAITKGISIVFNDYHVHRVEAYIMPDNIPSQKLVEKLTFCDEGISYSYANINGRWTDHKRYSIINPTDGCNQKYDKAH
jgi:ribosomal-protein-alanine N-acetyltransferase